MARHGVVFLLPHRLSVVRRGVAARQDHLALGEVLAGADAEPWLTRGELRAALRPLLERQGLPLRVEPNVAVTGMKEHAVPLAEIGEALLLKHPFDVGRGDDPGARRRLRDGQALHATVGGRVEQDAAADIALFGHPFRPQIAHADDTTARASLIGLFTPASVVVEVAFSRCARRCATGRQTAYRSGRSRS